MPEEAVAEQVFVPEPPPAAIGTDAPVLEPAGDQAPQPSAPWYANLSDIKDRFVTENGRTTFISTHENGKIERHPADSFEVWSAAMAKKNDHADKFIDTIKDEKHGVERELAELRGRFEQFQQDRQQAVSPQQPVADSEPDWNAEYNSYFKSFKDRGLEPEEAAQSATGWLEVQRTKYDLSQLKKKDSQRDQQFSEVMGAVKGFLAVSELKSKNPLLSSFSMDNPEVVAIMRQYPGADPQVVAEIWAGRRALAASQNPSGNGSQSPQPTQIQPQRRPMTEAELVENVRRQIAAQGGRLNAQPVGGSTDSATGGYVVTDADRAAARAFGNPTDDASIRKMMTNPAFERKPFIPGF